MVEAANNKKNAQHWNLRQYYNEYASYVKANLEIESIPMCFDKCIQGVEGAGLSSDEKNCMRECFLKRVSSKDDFIMLAT